MTLVCSRPVMMDEFEQYRSRAYSAGSRTSPRPTRSLPGTPRVKKYVLLQSLCGLRHAEGDPYGRGDDMHMTALESGRLPADGQDSTPGSPRTILQQPPLGGIPHHDPEPFRRAYSMKHHRPLRGYNSSPAKASTAVIKNSPSTVSSISSSTANSSVSSTNPHSSSSSSSTTMSSSSCGSTAVTAVSPPAARTDSPTPNSWRGRSPNRPKDLDLPRPIRPRTSSMPARSQYRRPDPSRSRSAYGQSAPGSGDINNGSAPEVNSATEAEVDQPLRRVRSFKTSGKGIINRGDSFKKRRAISTSQASLDGSGSGDQQHVVRPRTYSQGSGTNAKGGSGISGGGVGVGTLGGGGGSGSASVSRGSSLEQQEGYQYHVLMVGSQGVGKTALTQQFTTSEYMGHVDTAIDENEGSRVITVLLDGEESTMLVIDASGEEDPCMSVQLMPGADAYIVIYSVADRETFDEAIEVLHEIAKDKQRAPVATILVANKGDIVRNRTVTEEEGKTMAVRYDVKYIEVSAVLNHKVDELLAGILSQIRLKQRTARRNKQRNQCLPEPDNGCVQGAARGIIGKLFKNHPYTFRSCDNLMVL